MVSSYWIPKWNGDPVTKALNAAAGAVQDR